MTEAGKKYVKNLGKNIAYYRKQRKLTQVELAEKISVSKQTMTNWERGVCEMKANDLANIITVLKVSGEELVYGEKWKCKQNKQKRSRTS